MSNAEQASEPSMEDILASIRKIIAEEPDDAERPAAAMDGSSVADAARLDRAPPAAGEASSAGEASATQTSSEPVAPMPELVQPTIEGHPKIEGQPTIQAVSDVPGPVLELADEDSDDAAAHEDAGAEMFQASHRADDQPGDDQSTDDQEAEPQGAKTLSPFEALVAASTAPVTSGEPAPPPFSAAPITDGARGIDALLTPEGAETGSGSSASGGEPQVPVPLPSLKDLALGAPETATNSADNSVDELMSLLDGEPALPSASQEPARAGDSPLPPLTANASGLASLMAFGNASGDATGAAPANEPPDERVEPILPMPVSAFEAHVPKPSEALGPLLSRIDPNGAETAGPAAGNLAGIPNRDADVALLGLANDAEELNGDQTMDPAQAPGSIANALSASDGDVATAKESADAATSEPPLSTLLQNLGAAVEPVATPASQHDSAAAAADDHNDADAAAPDGTESGAGASIATAAALGALAAGIAAADVKPAKAEAPEDGPQKDAPTAVAPTTDAAAKTPNASPPPSQIASLGALLASAPGSLTAQSEFDRGADADVDASAVSGNDAAKDAAPEAAPAAAPAGTALTSSAKAPASSQILPSAVGDLVPGGVKTMEDTVTELLRPMLRDWLDSNMPRIVEKALRVELAATVEPDGDSNAGSSDG